MLIFRWSLYGEHLNVFMLNHSIATFQYFFREQARYVIFTDQRDALLSRLEVPAEVYQFDDFEHPFYLDTESFWRKWAPTCRFDIDSPEIFLDADTFLLSDPTEIREFCAPENKEKRFLVSMENVKALWPYGNFGHKLPTNFVPINAGLVGQYANADLSPFLSRAYHWWKENVPRENIKKHDEQGAIASILQHFINQGEVTLLSPDRYKVVCPLNDPPVTSLEGIVLLHATYPHHPAFYQFLPIIASISKLSLHNQEQG